MTARAKLEFTDAARSDLIHLRRYSLQQFGKDAADRYVDQIKSAFAMLAEMPLAGRAEPGAGASVRCYSKKRHRVFYRVEGERVTILRVLHHARDISQVLNE